MARKVYILSSEFPSDVIFQWFASYCVNMQDNTVFLQELALQNLLNPLSIRLRCTTTSTSKSCVSENKINQMPYTRQLVAATYKPLRTGIEFGGKTC